MPKAFTRTGITSIASFTGNTIKFAYIMGLMVAGLTDMSGIRVYLLESG